jgi:hypothetical protein
LRVFALRRGARRSGPLPGTKESDVPEFASCSLPDLTIQDALLRAGIGFLPFGSGLPHYSFLRGVAQPEETVTAAAEQEMPAMALMDTNGLFAVVPFYQAAKTAGVNGSAEEVKTLTPRTPSTERKKTRE